MIRTNRKMKVLVLAGVAAFGPAAGRCWWRWWSGTPTHAHACSGTAYEWRRWRQKALVSGAPAFLAGTSHGRVAEIQMQDEC